jgi:hypothetical protein
MNAAGHRRVCSRGWKLLAGLFYRLFRGWTNRAAQIFLSRLFAASSASEGSKGAARIRHPGWLCKGLAVDLEHRHQVRLPLISTRVASMAPAAAPDLEARPADEGTPAGLEADHQ